MQTAFDLHDRSGLVNQKMNARREGLPDIEHVAHNRDEHAVMIERRTLYCPKKFRHVINLTPVQHDDIEFLRLNRHERTSAFVHYPRRPANLLQHVLRGAQKLSILA